MRYRVIKDEVIKYFSDRGKLAVLFILIFSIFPIIRLFYLQVIQYEHYYMLSDNNRIRELRVMPDRGFIKDRNGTLLVINTPGYELEMVKEDVPNIDKLLDNLSVTVDINKRRVMRRVRESYKYEPIKITRGVNFDQISYLMEHSSEYEGIQFVVAPKRSYKDNKILCHLIGYMAEINEEEKKVMKGYRDGDMIGRSGLEKQFEPVLRGKPGSMRVEVDTFGRVYETLSENPATPGNNIILTLDYNLQDYASKLLEGRRGSVVVLENKDNSVLAMYSAPTYELDMFSPFITEENWNKLSNDPDKPLLNRSIEGAYPPGSVFKILMAIIGLSEGYITPETTFRCNGSFKATPRTTIVHHCWKKWGHGDVSLNKALAESCDVYFYNLGHLIGIDKIHEYATKFSLGHLTGIELPNEKTGVFPSKEWKAEKKKEPWYPGETINISIGQGYTTTTPLQVAVMTASIFNGGNVYVPRIVDAFENPITGEKTVLEPILRESVPLEPEYIEIVMKGLVSAVQDKGGTSGRARFAKVSHGGKTGTAQVVSLKRIENLKEEEIPEHWRDHSWYVGIYPSDEPRYTVVVMIENGGSGGKSSAPVAAQIINKMLELGYD